MSSDKVIDYLTKQIVVDKNVVCVLLFGHYTSTGLTHYSFGLSDSAADNRLHSDL